jgi:hypothetical protein
MSALLPFMPMPSAFGFQPWALNERSMSYEGSKGKRQRTEAIATTPLCLVAFMPRCLVAFLPLPSALGFQL